MGGVINNRSSLQQRIQFARTQVAQGADPAAVAKELGLDLRQFVDGYESGGQRSTAYATEREQYAQLFRDAGLSDADAYTAATELMRDLDGRQAPAYRESVQPYHAHNSNLAYLPFINPNQGTLDPGQLSLAMQMFGYPPQMANGIAQWMSQNVSPQQFYQPLWNAIGGRGAANLDSLAYGFAPPEVKADLAEAMRAQRAAGHAMSRPDLAYRRRRTKTPDGVRPAGVNPAGVNPAGVNPAGVNPAGVNPAGVNPAGVNPAGVNPAGVNPAGVNPAGVNPAGVNPAGVNPAGVNPAGVNPAGVNPAGVNPAGVNPAGVNPAGVNPAGVNPAGVNPAGVNPAGVNPAGVNPAGVNPAGVNPAGVNPAGVNPAGVNPAGVNPAGVNPANVNPAGVNPAGVNPADVNPADVNPAGVNPADVNPADVNPADVNPADVNPADVNPADVNPADVTPVQPTPPATPAPNLTLSTPETRVVAGLHGQDAKIVDNDRDGKISEGDVIQKADGTTVTLDRVGATELNQRSNLVKLGMSNPDWKFTSSPTPRLMDSRGRTVQQNEFWEMAEFNDATGKKQKYLKLREGADPAEAVEHMRTHASQYGFDCMTAIRAANLIATKDTVGDEVFSRNHQNLWMYSSRDSHKAGPGGLPDNNAGMSPIELTRPAKWYADPNGPTSRTYMKDGREVTERGGWELQPHERGGDDQLRPGDWRYYENPNDVTTASQGWNTIYLGEDPPGSGKHQFWHIGDTFHDRRPGDMDSGIRGEFLGAARRAPDFNRSAGMR